MRATYQVDWIDEHGRRKRRTFSDPDVADKFERKVRSEVLVKRAMQIQNAPKRPS